jgi:uncharacterized membrane protein
VPRPRSLYPREGDGTSFDRVAFFVDAVFAISLTLIVVGVGVPSITDVESARDLWRALGDQLAEFVSFAIGLVVIGFYWTSHHAAFDRLAAVDRRYVLRTVGYLGLVAFLPYPIRLVGTYDRNPLSWVLLAVILAAVSTMETVLFIHSAKADLLRVPLRRDERRWEVAMSMTPVPMFLVGAPLAFVSPLLTLVAWASTGAVQAVVRRRRPLGVSG